MTTAELGKKRICPSCGGRFYDLTKSPAECPYCETVFNPDDLGRTKRTKGAAPVAEAEKKKVLPVVDDDDEDLVDVDDEADETDDENVESDVIEDTSDLGEDDDDMAEVIDNVDRKSDD